MSTIFAYCRVSTLDQDATMQEEAIRKAYPNAVIRSEKVSGTSMKGRDKLDLLLESVEEGDKLVVWKLDRLARDMHDLLKIVDLLKTKGAHLEILDQKIDTSTSTGTAFLQLLGVFAEFETNLRKERQAAGIAKAKRDNPEKYAGRKASFDKDTIKGMLDEGMSQAAISRKLGCSTKTVQRVKVSF
ncbi:recombinase family protein [Pseudodesulfovibrio sediminis]|uniref:Integrase-like protein y4lS n=1 Tax=Pseudodesulfovibrio sediminis TaxID=2810563 RepID=A0ABN6ESA5_9BACT|nr:recombinase family protein [Pseudodesulfovibrio sediminis]BCS88320.1 integrase-like protein y4lS [Pseudodesulfovibrio sediminis]